uniref:D,D-heptose 1,7-bisphosphate phosphatase n=1 Tax=candidate division WOR-3 bacterium TaxID=2052148 RepID=A0A7C4TB22_UNCW3
MRAVFLDRDGVINKKPPEGEYVISWEGFKFLPRVPEAIRRLNELKILVIIITNQRGVALGYLTEKKLNEIHQKMLRELKNLGALIDAIYYCPHDKGTCLCRKPEVGLFLQAKKDFPEIDFLSSFVVGDSRSDIEAGKKLGCKTILISPGLKEDDTNNLPSPHFIAADLAEAVEKFIAKII